MGLDRIKIGMTEDFEPVHWENRPEHCMTYGKTGQGKSSLILNGIESDYYSHFTQLLLDPSGETAEEGFSILKGKPYFLSLETPFSLNLMRLPYPKHIISSIACESINQTITVLTPNNSLTTKMTTLFREEMDNCLENGKFSLLSVRDRIANRRGDNETRDGILSRLNFILDDQRMNKILCGPDSVNIGELIKSRRSLIVSCRRMTPEQRVFLGTLTTQLVAAYMAYEATTKSNPASFWIDEAHLFVRDSFLDVLKRIRKFGVSVFMATQDMASFSDRINGVLMNVGTIITFRVAAREAAQLAREMDCTPQELQFLKKYWVGYLTGNKTGFCKTPWPPLVKKVQPRVEVKKESKGGWFPLESYQPA